MLKRSEKGGFNRRLFEYHGNRRGHGEKQKLRALRDRRGSLSNYVKTNRSMLHKRNSECPKW
jgi:hypothetical protein